VAVTQAHSLLGDNMSGMTAVIVGAGEMAILTAKHLLRAGCDVLMLGRDLEKVQIVAHALGENVKAGSIDMLEKYINRYRLLFSATSAKKSIITKELMGSEAPNRLWFDMAIPRDIEDMNVENLQLFRIDDLRAISENNHALREEQALRAGEIVQKYKDEFYTWLRTLSIEPVIKQMRLNVEDAIDKEMQRAIKKGYVPSDAEENMRKMAEQMFKRFLHDPTQNLRQYSTQKENVNLIESIKQMFNIDTEDIDYKQYKNDHHNNHHKKGYKA